MFDKLFRDIYHALLFYFRNRGEYDITHTLEHQNSLTFVFSPGEIKNLKEFLQIIIRTLKKSLEIVLIKANQAKSTWDIEIAYDEIEKKYREVIQNVKKEVSNLGAAAKHLETIYSMIKKYFPDSIETVNEMRFQFSDLPGRIGFYVYVRVITHWEVRKNTFMAKIHPFDIIPLFTLDGDVHFGLKFLTRFDPGAGILLPDRSEARVRISMIGMQYIVERIYYITALVNACRSPFRNTSQIREIKRKIGNAVKVLKEEDRINPENVKNLMKIAGEVLRVQYGVDFSPEELYDLFREASELLETL